MSALSVTVSDLIQAIKTIDLRPHLITQSQARIDHLLVAAEAQGLSVAAHFETSASPDQVFLNLQGEEGTNVRQLASQILNEEHNR